MQYSFNERGCDRISFCPVCTLYGFFLLVYAVELGYRFDSLTEDVQRHILVRRVDGIRLQTETHKNTLRTEHLLKGRDDGDASTDTDGQRTFAEDSLKATLRSLVGREVDRTDVAVAAMVFLHFHGNGVGSDTVEVVDYQLTDLVVVLMWDKTGRNLDRKSVV